MHPEVVPVKVNVPLPDSIFIAIVPFIANMFVEVLAGGVQDIVRFISPLIIPVPICPFMTVPASKQDPRLPILLKFMLLPVRAALVCIMLKVKDPNCWPDCVARVADQLPVAAFVDDWDESLDPPQATKVIASASVVRMPRYFI